MEAGPRGRCSAAGGSGCAGERKPRPGVGGTAGPRLPGAPRSFGPGAPGPPAALPHGSRVGTSVVVWRGGVSRETC